MAQTNDFWSSFGKSVAAEICRPSGKYPVNPGQRQRLSNVLGNQLQSHLAGPGARDAGFRPSQARDQETVDPGFNNGGPSACIDAESCMLFVQKLLDGLDGDQRESFLTMLADMLSQDAPTGNGPNNNTQSLDTRRQARDSRGPPARDGGMCKPAQDSTIAALNHKGFEARWGKLTSGVETWGRR